MSILLMRLAAPLQSWGDSSRFTRRETRMQPTKSGVLGLLAAADGRRRTDSIEDLVQLKFGVRVDQPGRLMRDYQTARPPGAKHSGLSHRYYLADAVFVAGVEGDRELLLGLDHALRSPQFPLFLGRRSCPPAGAVSLGVHEKTLTDALLGWEWQASAWHRRRTPDPALLEAFLDAETRGSVQGSETVRDVPRSFDSTRREYGWRDVDRIEVELPNPWGFRSTDFYSAVVGG